MNYTSKIEERVAKSGKKYYVVVIEFETGATITLFPSFDQQQLIMTMMSLA